LHIPCRAANLAGARERQSRELERTPQRRPAVIVVDRGQKSAGALFVRDRGTVLHLRRREGPAEHQRRIAVGAKGRDRKPKHGAYDAAQPPCGFTAAGVFDLPEEGQQLRRRDLGNRSLAQVRAGQGHQHPAIFRHGRRRGAAILKLLQKFIGDVAEGVLCGDLGG